MVAGSAVQARDKLCGDKAGRWGPCWLSRCSSRCARKRKLGLCVQMASAPF